MEWAGTEREKLVGELERGRWSKERWTDVENNHGTREEEEEGGQQGGREVWHASRIIPPAAASSSLSFWMRWAGVWLADSEVERGVHD